jgi:RNA polymerase sigma-70 factor, ECF subfamily
METLTLDAVSESDTESFAGMRPRLFGIARRVLGNASDADDIVQDAWIRWQGTDRGQIRDPAGFSSR